MGADYRKVLRKRLFVFSMNPAKPCFTPSAGRFGWRIFRNGVKLGCRNKLQEMNMEIASVGASGAYSSTSVQPGRPQVTEAPQQVERRESQSRPAQQVERTEETPRPVTNSQGQQTGTLINVQA
jgi:hypothetical protein